MQRISLLTAFVVGAFACSNESANPAPGEPGAFSSVDEPGGPNANETETGANGELPSVSLDGNPVHSRLVRLTHEQWEHSVRDVLRLAADPGLTSGFTGDPPNGTFSNNERALVVTPNLRLDYQRAAEALSQRVARDAAALARIYPDGTAARSSRRSGAVPIGVSSARTNRRAIKPSTIWAPASSRAAMRAPTARELVIEALLQSPHFVYRTELGDDGAPLSGYEIASKLSFLLRNTTPNDELLDAAAAGELDEPARVAEIAREMLDGPGAAEAVARFHGELFGLDRYLSIAKDPNVFPEHDEALNPDPGAGRRAVFGPSLPRGPRARRAAHLDGCFCQRRARALLRRRGVGHGARRGRPRPRAAGPLHAPRLSRLQRNAARP